MSTVCPFPVNYKFVMFYSTGLRKSLSIEGDKNFITFFQGEATLKLVSMILMKISSVVCNNVECDI